MGACASASRSPSKPSTIVDHTKKKGSKNSTSPKDILNENPSRASSRKPSKQSSNNTNTASITNTENFTNGEYSNVPTVGGDMSNHDSDVADLFTGIVVSDEENLHSSAASSDNDGDWRYNSKKSNSSFTEGIFANDSTPNLNPKNPSGKVDPATNVTPNVESSKKKKRLSKKNFKVDDDDSDGHNTGIIKTRLASMTTESLISEDNTFDKENFTPNLTPNLNVTLSPPKKKKLSKRQMREAFKISTDDDEITQQIEVNAGLLLEKHLDNLGNLTELTRKKTEAERELEKEKQEHKDELKQYAKKKKEYLKKERERVKSVEEKAEKKRAKIKERLDRIRREKEEEERRENERLKAEAEKEAARQLEEEIRKIREREAREAKRQAQGRGNKKSWFSSAAGFGEKNSNSYFDSSNRETDGGYFGDNYSSKKQESRSKFFDNNDNYGKNHNDKKKQQSSSSSSSSSSPNKKDSRKEAERNKRLLDALNILGILELSMDDDDYAGVSGVNRANFSFDNLPKREIVNKQYKEKAKLWHPDKNVGRDQAFVTEKFKEVKDAHEYLSGLISGTGRNK